MNKPTNAFVLRQSPSGVSQLNNISLPQNVIVNGWCWAKGLIEEDSYEKFREILRKTYYKEKSRHRVGYAANTMWRFLKTMQPGDWVVVPSGGGKFYVAEIAAGPPIYDDSKAALDADSSYRRLVTWLNDKQPLLRSAARSRLISRMKIRQTSANAKDLIEEIHEALVLASASEKPTKEDTQKLFADEVRRKMVEAALKEIQQGYMDERKFEGLVATVLKRAGASSVEIVPRQNDKGVDVKATFQIGGITPIEVGVQAKYYKGNVGQGAIDQLIKGLKAEDLTTGWLVTSGEIPEELDSYLESVQTSEELNLATVDGRQLAEMIIDFGLQDAV